MNDLMLNLAFFACGFGFGVLMFFPHIRLGIQVIREARQKIAWRNS
jgi:hypothetical protein